MLEITAGQDEYRYELDEVLVEAELPAHVAVVTAAEVDTEGYAEGELSDAELLGLAAEEAMGAVERGEIGPGGTTLDEVQLRRVIRRAENQRIVSALRVARVEEVGA